jgi:hypothetical protein
MTNLNGKLVSLDSTDGLRLKGYWAVSEKNIATIIHVHGNFGNFYENEFIPIMADKYTEAGINFLSVNNRGHDGIAEAYKSGELVYIGGAIELPEQCYYDIEGAVRFVENVCPRIILQGHSFGCQRILAYLLQNQKDYDFILLSPADTYRLQEKFISPESIDHQIARIKNEHYDDMDILLLSKEFGIRASGCEYFIPVSIRTFLALFEGVMSSIIRYNESMPFYKNSHAFVYYGGKDVLWTETKDKVQKFFEQHVADVHFCYREDGDHHFRGFETSLVDDIIEWIAHCSS